MFSQNILRNMTHSTYKFYFLRYSKSHSKKITRKEKQITVHILAFIHYLLIYRSLQYFFYTPFSFRTFNLRILQGV
jgi:hypothetical protein